MLEKVAAIIVSFNGGEKIISSINALEKVVDLIIIVDNGSNDESLKIIKAISSSAIKVIELDENMGIGCALNFGVKFAIKEKFHWVITMDQDSIVDKNIIKSYEKFISENENAKILTPNISLNNGGIYSEVDKEVEMAITSGNLVRLDIFDKIGFYNEILFIDSVDIEFCLRLKQHGERIFFVKDAFINHELGCPHDKNGFFSKFYSKHSPLRRYYIYRNYFYILNVYFFKFPFFVIKFTISHFILFLTIVLYERNWIENFKFIFKGLLHGLLGKFGKYSK